MSEIDKILPQERAYCIEAIDTQTALIKANELLLNLFCVNGNACGECSGCNRFIGHTHPNLCFIEGDSDEAKTKELRTKLIEFTTVTHFSKEHKAVIITEADKLHTAAQNTILKMLEEPPPGVIFVLTTAKKRKLLPTVLSRCIILKARANLENSIEDLAADFNLTDKQAKILFDAARSDFYYAKKLAGSDYFKIRDNMIDALDNLWTLKTFDSRLTEHLLCGDDISDKKDKDTVIENKKDTKKQKKISTEDIEKNLEVALIYIQDVLNYKYGDIKPANSDRIEEIKRHSAINDLKLVLTAEKFAEFIQKMALCKGINVRLGIMNMLFDILEAAI